MIDTWLTAAVLLALLSAATLLRLVKTKGRNDRYLAAILAIASGAFAGLMAGIGRGSLFLIDATLAGAVVCCIVIVAYAYHPGGDRA